MHPAMFGRLLRAAAISTLALLPLAAREARAQATSTNSISLQAKLDGVTGSTVNLTVQFWDAATGGNTVGAAIVLNNTPVSGGIVSIPVQVDPTIFNGATRYMGIRVNGATQELGPRTLVTSVPYSIASTALVSPLSARRLVQLSSDGVVIGELRARTGYRNCLSTRGTATRRPW